MLRDFKKYIFLYFYNKLNLICFSMLSLYLTVKKIREYKFIPYLEYKDAKIE